MPESLSAAFGVLAGLIVLWCLVASAAFVGAILAQEPVRRRVGTRIPGVGAKTGIILETDEEIFDREQREAALPKPQEV